MKTAEIKGTGQTENDLVKVGVSVLNKEALALMKQRRLHHLFVYDGEKFVGVVGSRELWTASETDTVGEVVKPDVPTIDENSDISQVLRVMVEYNLDAVALMRGGKISGIVTHSDMLRVLHNVHHDSGVQNLMSQGEALLSSPMVQNFMSALSSLGV